MIKLTLGDFEFARFEIPASINFGGTQKTVVHELVGGKRVIDTLGAIPDSLTWSGYFVGEQALVRARYVKRLLDEGKALPLTWDELAFTVVITSFRPEYRLGWRIPYTITCEPVSDDTAPIDDVPDPSVEQLVNDDMASATSLASLIGDPTLTGYVSALGTAISGIGDFGTAGVSTILGLAQPIATARAQVATLLNSSNLTMAAVQGVAGMVGGGDPIQMVSTLLNQTSVASGVQPLVMLDKTLGRMATNVAAVGATSSTLTVAGGNLMQIAAGQYGDAMDWTALARANGLTDPVIAGTTTLIIPPKPTAAPSGILNG